MTLLASRAAVSKPTAVPYNWRPSQYATATVATSTNPVNKRPMRVRWSNSERPLALKNSAASHPSAGNHVCAHGAIFSTRRVAATPM